MPAIELQQWQRNWVSDTARRKLLVGSRQVGKSFTASLEVCLDCFEKKSMWMMLSASDRQSKELIEKVKMHTAGANVLCEDGFFENTSIVQHSATFPNGSRIIALPANPDTARGFSGHVLLDEFALHRDAKAIWKAMVGATLRGFKLRVLSTFKGKLNKFYDLAKEIGLADGVAPNPNPASVGVWSGHWVDIYLAQAQGLKVDIAELREAVGDDDIWAEEFCCVPIDGAMDFISLELVQSCESPAATMLWDGEKRPGLYWGYDVARKRDLSAIWLIERFDDGSKITRGVITMERMPFRKQEEIARSVAAVCERGCIDSTGIGAMLAENLASDFPGKIEAVEFNLANKERMATDLKNQMENRAIFIPESTQIRRSIQAIKRFVGTTGNIRFDAARSDQGHADEFWALALANAAAQRSGSYIPASEFGTQGRAVMANAVGRIY